MLERLPMDYQFTYTIIIENAKRDIVVNNGNFKSAGRNEVIIKELNGVNSFTFDNVRKNINDVMETKSNEKHTIRFKLDPGYDNPVLSGIGTENQRLIGVQNGTYTIEFTVGNLSLMKFS